MRRNILCIIIGNSFHFLPVAAIDILSVAGIKTGQEVSAVLIACILPINRILNPLIYNVIKAVSNHQGIKDFVNRIKNMSTCIKNK